MEENTLYAQVILPLPVRGFFTYMIPLSLNAKAVPGKRVLVQFGKKKIYTAVINSLTYDKPEGNFEIKPVIDILDDTPVINELQLRLWQWASEYYMCGIGDFFKASLPAGLRMESETVIIANCDFDKSLQLTAQEEIIFKAVSTNGQLSFGEVVAVSGVNKAMPAIKSLQKKNLIIIREHLTQTYKPKTVKYIYLAKRIDTIDKIDKTKKLLEKARKQYELFKFFIEKTGVDNALHGHRQLKSTLLKESGVSASILKQLLIKNVLKEVDGEVSRIGGNRVNDVNEKSVLSPVQNRALIEIDNLFKDKDTVLLHGVTSSGKTEVYIHLIEEVIAQGKQVLYMLPEIALTSQITRRLKSVFGDKVTVYHSKYSDAERVELWNSILNEDSGIKIVLGVRSSVLLPFTNLGLIIVDEEHESTYKQYDPSPRYNARDLAIVLASYHKAKVLLGTATPSIETYLNAQTGLYGKVELLQRHKDIKMPEIFVVDIGRARKRKEMVSHFTQVLIQNIDEALKRDEQVILFQNRRGFSPFVECKSCGWVPVCKRCDVSLTYHKGINKLVCHYCGHTIEAVHRCQQCGDTEIETKGFGTEKIEDEIALIFPDVKTARLDVDTTRGKHGYEEIITAFEQQSVDILIGTQMVSKGLDFGNVSLVGILNADTMLRFPDFRAFERSFHLMAQVSGRAGRKSKQGKVIIQTYDPDNVIIKSVIDNDYKQMFITQLQERKQFFYPPYSRLIKLTLRHRDNSKLTKSSFELTSLIASVGNCKVLGPTTPHIVRIKNMYLKNILIKLNRDKQLQHTKRDIQAIIEFFSETNKQIQITIDVDPA